MNKIINNEEKVNPDVKYAIDRSQAEKHRGF